MSMISEQVKELRKLSEAYTACGHRNVGDKLKQAADTIESLSAKLEEPKWIPCSDHLPAEPEIPPYNTLGALVKEGTLQEYIVMLYGALKPTTLHYAGNGEWHDQWTGEIYRVTAWRHLPGPYKPNNQAAVQKEENYE